MALWLRKKSGWSQEETLRLREIFYLQDVQTSSSKCMWPARPDPSRWYCFSPTSSDGPLHAWGYSWSACSVTKKIHFLWRNSELSWTSASFDWITSTDNWPGRWYELKVEIKEKVLYKRSPTSHRWFCQWHHSIALCFRGWFDNTYNVWASVSTVMTFGTRNKRVNNKWNDCKVVSSGPLPVDITKHPNNWTPR